MSSSLWQVRPQQELASELQPGRQAPHPSHSRVAPPIHDTELGEPFYAGGDAYGNRDGADLGYAATRDQLDYVPRRAPPTLPPIDDAERPALPPLAAYAPGLAAGGPQFNGHFNGRTCNGSAPVTPRLADAERYGALYPQAYPQAS